MLLKCFIGTNVTYFNIGEIQDTCKITCEDL